MEIEGILWPFLRMTDHLKAGHLHPVLPYRFRPQRLAKGVQAGAGFTQTQFCFDLDRSRRFNGSRGPTDWP